VAAFLINDQTPESLGVKVARRDLVSFNFSKVVLEVIDADLASATLMNFRDVVTIKRDGAQWFIGRVYSTGTKRDGTSFSQSIEVRDAWWRFNEITYKQDWDGISSEAIQLGAGGTISGSGDDGASGLFVAAGKQLAYTRRGANYNDPLAFADEARNILGFAKYTENIEFTLGNIQGVVPLVPMSFNNRSIHETLADIALSSPDVISRFDYTATPPRLDIIEVQNAGTVSLASGDRIIKAKITPRDDIRVGTVRVNFLQTVNGAPEVAATQTAGGSSVYRPLNVTINLPEGMVWDVGNTRLRINADNGLGNFPVPRALADTIFQKYGRRYYEGDITIKDDDVGGTRWLGEALNITGGPADWATMNAQIIGVSEDIQNGETTLRLGPAAPSPERALRRINPAKSKAQPTATYGPLETYLAGNVIHVQTGLCGRDADGNEVIPEHTGAASVVDVAGLGAIQKVYLGVSFAPNVQAFTCVDADGNSFTEYAPIGTGVVGTARIQTNNTTPPPQGAIINMSTGAFVQPAVVYFLLAQVKWSSGPAPTVELIRKGNFDLIFIAPNRLYLRAYDTA
jgi:hypothetical protein